MEIKYYNNEYEKGIIIDWELVEKEYNKLKVPKQFYRPPFDVLKQDVCRWFTLLSERKVGKTTNILILGLILNKLYRIQTMYIRSREEELTANISIELTKVLREYDGGYYIKQITNGVYNSMVYKAKAVYYCFINEESEIERVSDEYIIKFLSIDNHEIYKSTFNAPRGDLIIFDEFIKDFYIPNEFVNFCDLKDTIGRYRQSTYIFMLANTLNTENKYFEELEIYQRLKKSKVGDKFINQTSLGTNVYVELIKSNVDTKTKNILNKLYYGFKNPKLNAITGGVDVWNFDNYNHIFTWEDKQNKTIIQNNIYIETSTFQLLRLEIVEYNERTFIEVYKGLRTYEDSIKLTLNVSSIDNKTFYGLGVGELEKMLNYAIRNKLIYFATNEVGAMFNAYLKEYKML